MQNNKKLTIYIDASALKHSSCMLHLFYDVVLGYKNKVNSSDIEFGSAFHKFRAVFREEGLLGLGKGIQEARAYFNNKKMYVKKHKTYMDVEFLQKACGDYASKYQKDNFEVVRDKTGKALIELRFAFPYYVDDLMEIIIAGTIDELGKFRNGIHAITDCKTSAVHDTSNYLAAYALSPQLLFYIWSLYKYTKAFPNSIIAEICKNEIGCFIDGVFFAGKDKDAQFVRSDVFMFKQSMIQEFDELVSSKIDDLINWLTRYISTGELPFREGMMNNSCIQIYGPCKYFAACAAMDNTVREIVLDQNYNKEQYNPLTHGE